MYKILTGIIFFFMIPYQLRPQILPKEGRQLNYRLIGFSFPNERSANKYKIEIAVGNYNSVDSFKKKIIKSFSCNKNKIIIEVPYFGKQYTWRAIYSNSPTAKGQLYHFSTTTNSCVDTSMFRLKILKHAETYKDAYLLMDGTKAMYDMNGNPLWFLPVVDTVPSDKIWGFGDMNYTEQGTITYLTTPKGGQVYEADFNGTVLWRGPNNGKVSGDSIENYNHEFVRFPNGHYMVLGAEYMKLKLPGKVDSNFLKKNTNKDIIVTKDSNNVFYQTLRFGTVIEYDQNSNVVWSWRSSKIFLGSDIYNHTTPMGTFDVQNVHENSFYFDEKNNVIYIGFRDISRILKVKYPEGNVLQTFGNTYKSSAHGYDNNQFYHQHSCRISQDGYLYLYNNNNRDKQSLPTLVMFQMPVSEKDTLKKIWEYQCTAEEFDTTLRDLDFSALGSVVELPDHSFLACMTASNYTRVFIVNRDKKVLWNAMPQRYSTVQHKWYPVIQYRADIILNRKDLEHLIWNAEQAEK